MNSLSFNEAKAYVFISDLIILNFLYKNINLLIIRLIKINKCLYLFILIRLLLSKFNYINNIRQFF